MYYLKDNFSETEMFCLFFLWSILWFSSIFVPERWLLVKTNLFVPMV